jgi:hypothetical protein
MDILLASSRKAGHVGVSLGQQRAAKLSASNYRPSRQTLQRSWGKFQCIQQEAEGLVNRRS